MAVRVKHPREPVDLAGNTTFYFVTDGIENALERAIQSAADLDVLGTNPSAASAPNSSPADAAVHIRLAKGAG